MGKYNMGDLETMGTLPGCAIVSIGVINFNPHAETVDELFSDHGFYTVVNRDSCLDAMLHEDASTAAWWRDKTTAEARKAKDQYDLNQGLPLKEALEGLIDYVATHSERRNGSDALLYGNGADFDNPILNVAARMVGVKLPWKWGNRCYRTLKNLDELLGINYAAPMLTRSGTYHNALDDSKTQAMHLWELVQNIKKGGL